MNPIELLAVIFFVIPTVSYIVWMIVAVPILMIHGAYKKRTDPFYREGGTSAGEYH